MALERGGHRPGQLVGPLELVLAQIDHGEHGLVGEQEEALAAHARSSASSPARYSGTPADRCFDGDSPWRRPRPPGSCPTWPPGAACRAGSRPWPCRPGPTRARAWPGRRRGLVSPGTSGSSKARSTTHRASTSRMPARNRFPSPSPVDDPETSPAMSTTSMPARTTLRLAAHLGQGVEAGVGERRRRHGRLGGGERDGSATGALALR